MNIFVRPESYRLKAKTVGSPAQAVSNSFLQNLMLKWLAPTKSGSENIEQKYLGITVGYEDITGAPLTLPYMGSKPWILTIESRPGEEGNVEDHLIMYTLDVFVENVPEALIAYTINPDIDNNGNNRIHKLDGGALSDSECGVNWTVIVSDGEVVEEGSGTLLLGINPFRGYGYPNSDPTTPPAPFLLYRRKDIA